MLTDFQNSFTGRLTGKFATKSYLNIPPRLKYVATLPCEIWISYNMNIILRWLCIAVYSKCHVLIPFWKKYCPWSRVWGGAKPPPGNFAYAWQLNSIAAGRQAVQSTKTPPKRSRQSERNANGRRRLLRRLAMTSTTMTSYRRRRTRWEIVPDRLRPARMYHYSSRCQRWSTVAVDDGDRVMEEITSCRWRRRRRGGRQGYRLPCQRASCCRPERRSPAVSCRS